MKTWPLQPFGVEAANMSLADALTEELAATVRGALAKHGVMVFRGQDGLTDDGFVGFLSALGPLTFTEGERAVDGAPSLNLVTNVGRTRPPRSVFHTDTSYVSRPPAYTSLRIVEVPESGGDTLFSDQYRAWASLPSALKARLAGRTVRHRVTGLAREGLSETETRHPLSRQHPISNRRALFLSTPERCTDLSDVPDAVSDRILKTLYRHSTRRGRLYRHRWRQGDVVVWDNRCTMHRADHSDVVGRRTLHRGMVGENDSGRS